MQPAEGGFYTVIPLQPSMVGRGGMDAFRGQDRDARPPKLQVFLPLCVLLTEDDVLKSKHPLGLQSLQKKWVEDCQSSKCPLPFKATGLFSWDLSLRDLLAFYLHPPKSLLSMAQKRNQWFRRAKNIPGVALHSVHGMQSHFTTHTPTP